MMVVVEGERRRRRRRRYANHHNICESVNMRIDSTDTDDNILDGLDILNLASSAQS